MAKRSFFNCSSVEAHLTVKSSEYQELFKNEVHSFGMCVSSFVIRKKMQKYNIL